MKLFARRLITAIPASVGCFSATQVMWCPEGPHGSGMKPSWIKYRIKAALCGRDKVLRALRIFTPELLTATRSKLPCRSLNW
jgi:hypothetical protein